MIRVRSSLVVAFASVFALSACMQPTSYGNTSPTEDPNAKAKRGALIGAGVGALTGLVTAENKDDRGRNAVIGAALGAGAGAVIGNQLDKQEAELRQQLGNDVNINNTGDRLIVSLPQDILFATDSAVLRPDLQADIRTVASSLQAYPDTTVQVVGHTDNSGDASYNLNLSRQRAQSVAAVLIAEGISSTRLQSIGAGEDQPIASNLTPEGKAQNRRVEIVILPNAA